MTKTLIHIFTASVLLFWALPGSGTPVLAEVTGWQDLGGGRARLVTVFDPVSGKVEGIVDVELMPGWTTYWRNPGEGGIPPDFNFSGSKGVVVDPPEFPVPTAKESFGIISVVYKKHVAFPFKATPLISPRISPLSGELRLDILLGVCETICIPAAASFSQDLSRLNRSDPVSWGMIALAKQKLPVTNANEEWPQILDVERKSDSTVLIRTQIPGSAKKLELFVEGKDTWFFNPAKLLRREGMLAEFDLSLSDLPKDADLAETPLRLTLVADGIGSERTIVVDKAE